MNTLDIDVLGQIGASASLFGESGFTSEGLAARIAGYTGTIKLRINSPGGSCFEALTIYNLLRQSGCRVEVEVLGLAASAASLIAMAGDDIAMATGSMMMIHEPRLQAAKGTAEELREAADTLDRLRASFAEVYASRSGKTPADMVELLGTELWMSADEAIAEGFAHRKLTDAALPLPAMALEQFPAESWEPLRAAALVTEVPPVVEAEASAASSPEAQAVAAFTMESALAQLGFASVNEAAQAKAAMDEVMDLRNQMAMASASLQETHAKATAAEAQAADLRAQLEQKEREGIVATLTAERKTCPAQADFLASLSLEALRAYQKTAPVIVPQSKVTEAATASDGVDRWNGKTWAELRKDPAEMRALFEADPELFKRMQTAAQKRR
jgi:ATP-dependent Clp protease, protease subunit